MNQTDYQDNVDILIYQGNADFEDFLVGLQM